MSDGIRVTCTLRKKDFWQNLRKSCIQKYAEFQQQMKTPPFSVENARSTKGKRGKRNEAETSIKALSGLITWISSTRSTTSALWYCIHS